MVHFGTKLIPASSFFRSKKTSTLMSKPGIINFRVGTKVLPTNTIKKKKKSSDQIFACDVTKFSEAIDYFSEKKKFKFPGISEA